MNPKPRPPLPGGEHVQVVDTGPQRVSPNATRVNLIPVGDGGSGPRLPHSFKRKRKPALPNPVEIAALPAGARAAFAARCAARVAPLVQLHGDEVAATMLAACAILRVARDPREVAVIRRDFERIKRLARREKWTDDTPVPPEVFGPLWPGGRVPKWAHEPNQTKG